MPKVPYDELWLVERQDFIGEANIRYALSDFLRQHGGHVGYDIRPSRQRQGYGTLILKLALYRLRQHGIDRVLVTCDDTNIASWKIIEANGGILQDKIPSAFHTDSLSRRYWIMNA